MPLITSQQLKQLSVKQLPDVCEEIREKLISDVIVWKQSDKI